MTEFKRMQSYRKKGAVYCLGTPLYNGSIKDFALLCRREYST